MFNKKFLYSMILMFFLISIVSAFGFSETTTTTNYINLTNGTSFDHNDLLGIQGGVAGEYYHIRQSWFDELTSDLFDWITQAEGDARYLQSYTETDPKWLSNYTDFQNKIFWADVGNGTLALNSTFGDFRRTDNHSFLNGTSYFSGNVGIGTTSPSQLLDVNGNVTLGNDALFVDNNTGYVGINTTIPSSQLEVYGETKITEGDFKVYSSNAANVIKVGNSNNGRYGSVGYSAGYEALFLGTDTYPNVLSANSGGYLGVNTLYPASIFHAVGDGDNDIFRISAYKNASGGALLKLYKSRGSYTTPATSNVEDAIGNVDSIVGGETGETTITRVKTKLEAIDWEGNDGGGSWEVMTKELGGSLTSRFFIGDDGLVGIEITTPLYPLHISSYNSTDNISIWAERNISATGFITRTSIYDKSKGDPLDYVQDSDYYVDDGKINHSKFYGYAGQFLAIDYSKPEYRLVDCEDDGKPETCINETYFPNTKIEEGISLDEEIDVLRQAIYELKIENDLMKQSLCNLGEINWC